MSCKEVYFEVLFNLGYQNTLNMNVSVSSFLSALSEKITSGLFKVQGGVNYRICFNSSYFNACIFKGSGDSNSECWNRIWFHFKKTEVVWSKYNVISWI